MYQKVKKAVFERDANDGTIVMLQMTVTKQNAPGIEEFVETVKEWPVTGVAFTFYVPTKNDDQRPRLAGSARTRRGHPPRHGREAEAPDAS